MLHLGVKVLTFNTLFAVNTSTYASVGNGLPCGVRAWRVG